jgi:hypothetical protein
MRRGGVNDTRQGGKGLTTARQSGGGRHNERKGVEDTMQGNWAADGMTRGGGADNAHALVVDSFWRRHAGGGVLKTSLKLYLKIVPQTVQKKPRKIGFSKGFFARFNVRFAV